MKAILTILACVFASILFSQNNIQQTLSVNADGALPDASAQLDVQATDKGMLVPRMTTAQRTAIASPATGLLVFDTTTGGFWFYSGTAWTDLSAPKSLQDADGNTKVQVEKNPNEDIIRFDLGGTENMVLRKNAGGSPRLELLDGGLSNTFVGTGAGSANTTGVQNTAIGNGALSSNTTGYGNTANGLSALFSNTTGYFNTANGLQALFSNTTGFSNTANGFGALYFNTTGSSNIANGEYALFFNTTGSSNTANGYYALSSNTTGSFNTGIGWYANVLGGNRTNATAIGYNAIADCSNCMVLGGGGADAVNVGIGTQNPTSAKLVINTTAGSNGLDLSTADAYAELRVIRNTLNAGDKDLYLGYGSPLGSVTRIYSDGEETIIAKNQRAGIGRNPITNRLEVEGNASKSSAGSWLGNSDVRLKKNIAPLDSREMLDKLLALQGITYEWNDDKTGSSRPEGIQYGFTAQNIQTVFPTLVEEDNLGYLQTAYGTYDAMTVEAIRALSQENEALKAKVETLTSQLDKISAALQGAGITVEK